MRLHEIMGIEANRTWGVCSLNDFRKFLGLKSKRRALGIYPILTVMQRIPVSWNGTLTLKLLGPQKSFMATLTTWSCMWVSRPRKPSLLWRERDCAQVFALIQMMLTKTHILLGYTITRAILSDAIALTRGDRFFTQDFTPYNMTAWGFADCQRDPSAYGFGSTMGRLLLRTLPNDYTVDSIYTWFPFVHPESMEGFLKNLDKLDGYSLERPKPRVPPTIVNNYVDVAKVLHSPDKFVPEYVDRAALVIQGKGCVEYTITLLTANKANSFFAASENGVEEQQQFINALAPSPEAVSKICTYFHNKTKELIEQHSFTLVGEKTRAVNIIRDVFKLLPLHWAATEVVRRDLADGPTILTQFVTQAGISIKNKQNPDGIFTESRLFDMLSEIYQLVLASSSP